MEVNRHHSAFTCLKSRERQNHTRSSACDPEIVVHLPWPGSAASPKVLFDGLDQGVAQQHLNLLEVPAYLAKRPRFTYSVWPELCLDEKHEGR